MAIQRGSRDEFSRGELREKQEKQENQKQYQVLCHPTVTQNLGHSLALLFLALRPSKPHIYKKATGFHPSLLFVLIVLTSRLVPKTLISYATANTLSAFALRNFFSDTATNAVTTIPVAIQTKASSGLFIAPNNATTGPP